MKKLAVIWGLSLIACLCWQAPSRAHVEDPASEILKKVKFEQKLNSQVPLDLIFRDENGRSAPLSAFMNGKPTILSMIYYRCSQLCFLDSDELLRSMKELKFTAGKEYQVITVSVEPKDTPGMADTLKKDYVKRYDRPEGVNGWHFLVGDKTSIDRLADSIGYRFAYDPKLNDYAHPDGITVLTPGGKVSHYFFQMSYPARDLKFALMQAASERIGSPLEYFALSCYHYNPVTGKYSITVMNIVRGTAILTVLMLAGLIAYLVRIEKQNKTNPVVLGRA
jgi:protein SCO1/2